MEDGSPLGPANGRPPFGGLPVIADSSAWSAIHRARLLGNVPPEWPAAIRRDQLLTSPVVKLELLHSTRNGTEFAEWDARLAVLRAIDLTATVANSAVGALRELAPKGDRYHRVGLADALIAASAQDAGVGVLHYNPTDFDRLREVMHFENVLLAPVGTFEH